MRVHPRRGESDTPAPTGTLRLLPVRHEFHTGRVVCRHGQVATRLGGRTDVVGVIPAGSYDVHVVGAEFEVDWGGVRRQMHRGAAVFVRVTSEEVETWALARTEAGGPARMSVDHARGCLADESFVQDHDEWLQTPARWCSPSSSR